MVETASAISEIHSGGLHQLSQYREFHPNMYLTTLKVLLDY
jgi:hypothetical protein